MAAIVGVALLLGIRLDGGRSLDGHAAAHAESALLTYYGRRPAAADPATVARVHERLDRLLPGQGTLAPRLAEYSSRFLVSRSHLDRVVHASLDACRTQSRRHIALPARESVSIVYTADPGWSGFSIYRSPFQSTLRINRTTPFTIGQLLTLMCHEGYPGHHVFNTLRDGEPAMYTAEGAFAEAWASEAAEAAFTPAEREQLLREQLMPLAGLDATESTRFVEVERLVDALGGVISDALAQYLEQRQSRADAIAALEREALVPNAATLVDFADRTGPYALAYTFGRQLMADAVAAQGGDPWQTRRQLASQRRPVFHDMIEGLSQSPTLSSGSTRFDPTAAFSRN